jgi:prolyl-tRNA editing enzyme YbaK/EbsC (Cys-tRNA(Pro) deacylase)
VTSAGGPSRRGPEDETAFSDRFAAFGAVRHFPQGTRTAQEAAAAVGCDVAQICKSLVFRLEESDRPLLVITSGANRVDTEHVGALLRPHPARLSKADAAFVREQSGFAIGGVPPFGWVGAAPAVETLVDEDLLGFDVVWAAAGTPNAVFAIAPAELVERSGARVVRVAR